MFKYTKDNKKVVVCDVLNENENIVQEIVFTKDGKELITNEKFVVQTLYDEPVFPHSLVYENRTKEQLEKNINRLKVEESQLCENIKLLNKKIKYNQSLLQNSPVLKNFDKSKCKTLTDFLEGNIEYIVVERYSDADILPFDDCIATYDNGSFDGLKLITLLGKTNGNIEYRIHHYSDGSGSWNGCHLCTSYNDALIAYKNFIDTKLDRISFETYKKCIDMGLIFSSEQKKILHDRFTNNFESAIKKNSQEIKHQQKLMSQNEETLKQLNSMMDEK